MTLTQFIHAHHQEIIAEFEVFAETLMPAGANLSPSQLRDHAEEMLTAMVQDMDTVQSQTQQSLKARGFGSDHMMMASGKLHAGARIGHGFRAGGLVAEFRALRASVLRLYQESGGTDLAGVRRFNESVDELLAESISHYEKMTDLYRDQFLGILGHDLRGPLSAIASGADLLVMSAEGGQRAAAIAPGILRSAQRMARMIDDILDFTRDRLGGAIPLKRVRTDLEQVCHEVIREVETAHPTAAVRLESTGDLSGEWDRDRLIQVVSNLVGNAIQHGDGKSVRLVAQGHSEEVVLAIHNSGMPIPADATRSIFEPLVRRPPEAGDDAQRLGLGLFIARAIVKGHGGQIDVTSSENEGTTFTVRLPRKSI